jgi:S-adenosylmethionine hydrolase
MLIALTTDFGPSSHYVAQMKGVILSAVPEAHILDITHAIPPRSIRHAEVMLRSAAFSMPVGTVHVVVVDPGVGTERRPIAVTARGTTFVGPDNGVLGVAVREPGARAVVLDRTSLFRRPVSHTFHGRDLFAPVAAELAAGLCLQDVGTAIDDPMPSTLPDPVVGDDQTRGEVLIADRFGNLLTNIPATHLDSQWRVRVAGEAARWVRTYGDARGDELLALAGSDGYIEIAVRNGSASSRIPDRAEVVCTRE